MLFSNVTSINCKQAPSEKNLLLNSVTFKSLKNQNTIKVMITLGSRKNNRFYSRVGVGAGQNITAPATLLT